MLDNDTTTRPQNHHQHDANKKLSPLPQASASHLSPPLKQNDVSQEEKKSEYGDTIVQRKEQNQYSSHASLLPQPKEQPTPTHENQQQQQGSILLLILCATGICTCYLSYGILQERLFSSSYSFKQENDDEKPITTFLLLIGVCFSVFISQIWIWIECLWQQQGKKEAETSGEKVSLNHGLLLLTSFCYVAAMTASNESINYVSYPTVVLAKSSKLIPTMIMGYFVEKKAYSLKEWLGASLITAGIIIFNLSRMSASKGDEKGGDSVFGLALLAFSLFMDGLLSSCQGIMKENGKSGNNQQQYRCPSAMEMMLFTNLYAAIFIAPLSVYSGQFSNGIDIITKSTSNPTDNELSAIQLIALLNGSAAAGQVFVFLTIHHFSSLVCTTITTTRKFFTILLSVRNFGHVFSAVQWCSIFMVFGGLYFEIVSKNIGTSGDKKKMKKA